MATTRKYVLDTPQVSHGSCVTGLPDRFYYLPNILSPVEEEALLLKINSSKWVELKKRRLQVYPAQLTTKNVLLSNSGLPGWLASPLNTIFTDHKFFTSSTHTRPNHVLINQYGSGEGIMPHEDGDAYFPITATISLGSHTVLDLYEKNAEGERLPQPTWRVLQEPRSLLVTYGEEAYGSLLHGISEVPVDEGLGPESIVNWGLLDDPASYAEGKKERQIRTSLTCRDVVKVSTLRIRLIGKK